MLIDTHNWQSNNLSRNKTIVDSIFGNLYS